VWVFKDTNECVGSLIKGVSKFCAGVLAKMPGFKLEIRDARRGAFSQMASRIVAALPNRLSSR
jgi:hypothetical protein